MTVITRFAPSPTGYLHIGGARTAMFNYLYAKRHGGKFLLRIEDTDQDRNVDAAIQPIIDGMEWLGISPDGPVTFQSLSVERHAEVAHALLERGAAYRCYTTPEELEALRTAPGASKNRLFRSPWRDAPPPEDNRPFVIRIKAPREGEIVIEDAVQGRVRVRADTLDDFVILRADGTPTYMLASVVDDHDSGITTVIRGDDHLNNAFRQLCILRGMEWPEPTYAHIPLIFSEDGKKLSKRTGAAGLEEYREAGYVADAMFNYLLRLGWGHGDQETFTRADAEALFDLDAVGKAPARLNAKKLLSINAQYIRDMSADEFYRLVEDRLESISPQTKQVIADILPLIQPRCKTLAEAVDMVHMVLSPTLPTDKVDPLVVETAYRFPRDFDAPALKALSETIAQEREVKLNDVVAPMRIAIMGSKITPPLFEVMELLGREECLRRIERGAV